MSDENNLEQFPTSSEDSMEELELDLKNNARDLGIIVECGELEEGLGDYKKYASALLAGIALNAFITGNAYGNVDCMIDRNADLPTIKCDIDPADLKDMPDELVRPDVKDLFDKEKTDEDTRNLFELPEEVTHIKFVKNGNYWEAALDIGYGDIKFDVDPSYTEKLDQGYEEEKAGLESGAITYDDDLNLGSSSRNSIELSQRESVEENIGMTFSKCILEMVEKDTFNRQELHDAFIKALN